MTPARLLAAQVATFLTLMVCGGLAQVLPWGVPAAQSLRAASPETVRAFGTDAVASFPVGSFTTVAFAGQLNDHVSILMTDESVAWIVARPIAYYDPGAYMTREALTQALVALGLTALMALTASLPLGRRLAIVALAGVAASTATYGQLTNWWGLPLAYGGGASLNLVASWTLAAAIVGRFALPSTPDARP